MKKITCLLLLAAIAVTHNSCQKQKDDTVPATITTATEAKSNEEVAESAVAGKTRVYVTGTATLASNNTHYLVNVTEAPTKIHDQLNEFNGAVFKAKNDGLYYVSMSVSYDQRNSDKDHGDGFLGGMNIRNQSNDIIARSWGKIPHYEIHGSGTPVAVAPSIVMVQLKAGQSLSFRLSSFGSTGDVVGKYSIVIYSLN